MGTKNPKVSAYVPKPLKDRLEEFTKERNASESQAVTIILAEYFQMPEVLGRSPESGIAGGVTLARMEALEEKLVDFTASVENRLQALGEDIRKITGILVVHEEILDIATEQVDEVLTVDRHLELEPTAEGGQHNDLSSELPIEPLIKDAVDQETQPNELTSDLLSELPNNLSDSAEEEGGDKQDAFSLVEHQDSSLPKNLLGEPLANSEPLQLEFPPVKEANNGSLLNEPPVKAEETEEKNELLLGLQSEPTSELQEEIKPIPGTKLSKLRFGRSRDTLAGVKRKIPPQEFTEWTQNEDPDKIPWKHTAKGYVPIGELTDEQKSSLLRWYKENP
jgi:hypothetical protein